MSTLKRLFRLRNGFAKGCSLRQVHTS